MNIIFVDANEWNEMRNAIMRIETYVRRLDRNLNIVTVKEDKIMSALTDQLDALEKNTTAIDNAEDSAEAAFTRLAAMIADLKTGVTDPAVLARIKAVSDELAARAGKLAAAVVATPT